jgi:hypothetical protein
MEQGGVATSDTGSYVNSVPCAGYPRVFAAALPSPVSKGRARSSCVPRRASRACGAIRASAPKRATSSPRSTAGSPKTSTRAI